MKFNPPSRLAAAMLALAAWMPLQANAALFDDDEARKAILDLRAKVDTLSRELNARIDTKFDRANSLELLEQNEQMRSEIAKLRGQLEVLSNEVATVQKRQKDLYADLDARLRKLEPQQVTIDGREAEVDPNEQKTFEAATALFKGGDYKGAASALAAFVRRYPESGYAALAQYTLGNAYYILRDYKNAISAQQVVASTYKDSSKAPEAMLSIASSYAELKDKKNARKTLQDLIKQYPDSPSAADAKERLAALK